MPKATNQARNRYLNFLIDASFKGVIRLFVLSLKDEDARDSHRQYYLPTVEMKDHNIMIDGRNFFDHPIKIDLKTYDNIRKISTGQCDDYTDGWILDYPYFKNYYKLIAIDLSKQQKLGADRKAIQQVNFTGSLRRAEGATMFFIIEKAKETVLDFSKGTVQAL